MIAAIIIGCILLAVVSALSLRIKITVTYKDEVALYVSTLFFRIKLYPRKKKQKGPHSMSRKRAARIRERLQEKEERKRLRKEQKKQEKSEANKAKKDKPNFSDVLDTVDTVRDIALAVVRTSLGHLRVDLARFHITVATGDAATTAVIYGAVCEALEILFAVLEDVKGFRSPKTKDLSVNYDFLEEQTKIDIKLSFSMRVWHGIHIALSGLIKYIARLVKKQANAPMPLQPNSKKQ